jgi:hypothetical protein
MKAGRISRQTLSAFSKTFAPVTLLVIALTACSSTPPPPAAEPPKAKGLSPETSAKIDEALDYLNNPNVEERWRNQLVTCAGENELARQAAIERTVDRVKRSYEAGSRGGPGVLKPAGRRRAFEALDKFGGDDESVLSVLKQGTKEPDAEVCAAAAAGLAARGDEGAFAALVTAVRLAKDDAATQGHAAAALLPLAKPERLPVVLGGVDAGSRPALTPVVLRCLPQDAAGRGAALRKIAREEKNPEARALAFGEIQKLGGADAQVLGLARDALLEKSEQDAELRGAALEIVAAQRGDDAAQALGAVLDTDPKDAVRVAACLAKVDAMKTIDEACRVLDDRRRKPSTRAAVAREVLARLRDLKAAAALRADASVDKGRASLRHALDDADESVAQAAAAALGTAGDASDTEALGLRLETWKGSRAEAAVRALGQLGGGRASEVLVGLHGRDATLRSACREALVAWKDMAALPADQGLALIRQLGSDELALRKSALAVLRALKGDPDVQDYDPDSAPAARERSIERWKSWWREKVVARGG